MYHILIENFACVVTAPVKGQPDFLQAAIDKGYSIIYILANNGDKFVRRKQPGKNTEGGDRFVTLKIPTIPGFSVGEIKEENQFLPAGKIPFVMMKEIEKFFKAVIAKFGDKNLESMIWIMWNEEQGYFLHVPNQKVAGAAVTYDWSPPVGSQIIVDIHSHADFGAFFSGTDDRDDSQSVRYSGVFGYNRRPDPMKVFRFNFMDVKRPVELGEIFEAPTVAVEDTPAEWLEKVEIISYSAPKGGQHYHGNPNGYSGSSYWDTPDPSRYKAPKPSNATAMSFRGGQRGWALKSGGFVALDDWEKEYPEALKAQRARQQATKEKAKARKAAKNGDATEGGQQGTSPLDLDVRETEQSSASQKETSESLEPTKEELESSLEATGNLQQNGSENGWSNSVTRFPSTTYPSSPQSSNNLALSPSPQPLRSTPAVDRDFQVSGQTQVTKSSQTTSSSAAPSTDQSSEANQSTTEPEPAGNSVSDTSQTLVRTTGMISTTTGASVTDPLGVFTELVNRPVGYVSEAQGDGSYALRTVVLDVQKTPTDVALDQLEASYSQELREAQGALQDGSMASLMDAVEKVGGKAPEGVLQVEIPTTAPILVKKAVITGSSEVSPLGSGFSPDQPCPPLLQQRQVVPQLQQQPPTLMRRTPTSQPNGVGEPGGAKNGWTQDQWLARNRSLNRHVDISYVAGESVDTWLARRAAQIDQEMGIGRAAPAPSPVSESSIDRMHNRARQEALLRDAEELAELQEGAVVLFRKTTPSGVVNVMPDNTIVLRLEGETLPASFNADCADYGTSAAGAKALIDVAIEEIVTNGSLLRRTVQSMFELVEEDSRLPLFRTLVQSLPANARDDLGTNGL